MDPDTGEVLRAMPFGPHAPSQLEPPGRQRSRRRCSTSTQTRVLDPRTGRQSVRAGVDRRRRRHRNRRSSLRGRPRAAMDRRTSSCVMRGGDRSAGPSASTAMSMRRSSSRAGARSRSRATRSWTSTTRGRWPSRGPLEGHSGEVLGIELAGPGSGLAVDRRRGRNGGRLRPDRYARSAADAGPGRGRGRRVLRRRPGGAHPEVRDRARTPRASSTSTEGRDLFGELQPFTDCVCQIGHTAITPDGRLALGGVFEWTDDYAEAITDRGVSSSGTPTPAN